MSRKLNELRNNMLQRCFNRNNPEYINYGGRGISVCPIWILSKTSFFIWCKNNGYENGLQLDREDNNGDYEPFNCRFVIPRVNSLNKRVQNLGNTPYQGIHFCERTSSFESYIKIKGKKFNLGRYTTLSEALEARNNFILDCEIEDEYDVQKIKKEAR